MGAGSIWHWILLLLVIVLLFGRGKISELMGDVAGGIKAFKKGMSEDDEPKRAETPKTIEGSARMADAPAKDQTKTY